MQFNLKCVPIRSDFIQVYRFENFPMNTFKSGSGIFYWQTGNESGIFICTIREKQPSQRPVNNTYAFYIARTYCNIHISASHFRNQPWQIVRVMRKICIHFTNVEILSAQCETKTLYIRSTQAQLAFSFKKVQPAGVLHLSFPDTFSRSIWRGVINDQEIQFWLQTHNFMY